MFVIAAYATPDDWENLHTANSSVSREISTLSVVPPTVLVGAGLNRNGGITSLVSTRGIDTR